MTRRPSYPACLRPIRDYLLSLDELSEADKERIAEAFYEDLAWFKVELKLLMLRRGLILPDELLKSWYEVRHVRIGDLNYEHIAELQERNKAALAESDQD